MIARIHFRGSNGIFVQLGGKPLIPGNNGTFTNDTYSDKLRRKSNKDVAMGSSARPSLTHHVLLVVWHQFAYLSLTKVLEFMVAILAGLLHLLAHSLPQETGICPDDLDSGR
jgi:hypothetical protein